MTITRPATDARQSYAEAHAEAMALLDNLREMIEDMPEPESDGINWGHVGSLGHLNEKIKELCGFIEG